ncbi:MAG: 23S rRNA (guanosine(2251)-2'-O)-methyltransferase RlmB [Spirochaetes bacterium]|nr:23S rRNA (guanosine(2251)-2'-O)-methyltransferase RlmB [Spirochaetota bacterium]
MIYLTGFHAIEERIKFAKSTGAACGPLLLAKPGPRAKEVVALAVNNNIRVDRVGTFELEGLAPGNRGIALRVDDIKSDRPDVKLEEFIENLGDRKDSLVLLLDEITDPHNYGAILRTCDQLGADLVVSRNRRSAKHAEVLSKTSAGAVNWVPQAETANLVRAADNLKDAGFWIYGADMEGEALYKKDFSGRTAFVLGSEGAGVSRLLKERCDAIVGIPCFGKIDSLNVSVAAGVLLYEARRQRG